METEEIGFSHLKAKYDKSINFSIRSIESLHKETAYKVKLNGFPLDKSIATSIKTKNSGFRCKFFLEKLHDYTFNQNPERFGLSEDVILDRSGKEYLIKKNSFTKANITLSEPQVITINVRNLQSAQDEKFNHKLLRLIIPVNKRIEFGNFWCKSLNINDGITVGGLIETKIGNKNYHLFRYENEDTKKKYFIIDSAEENIFSEFKENTRVILLALGCITGNLLQNEFYYQSIRLNKEAYVEEVAFEQQESSIISNVCLLDYFQFEIYLKDLKEAATLGKLSKDWKVDQFLKSCETLPVRFTSELFSKLCETLKANKAIARCVLLILEGNQSKFMLHKASMYSVALETLTNVIYEENKEKLNPIPDGILAAKVQNKMVDIINENKEFLSDYGEQILKAKINDLNKPTNSKKLTKPFELYGIHLSKDDINILNYRNKFLHGSSPFNEEELLNKDKEINYISKKLHFLTNCLILKYIGYKGHIVNYPAWHQFNWKEKITDPLYVVI